MKRIILIDNFDSFTHNLKHYVEGLNFSVDVFRNDEVPLDIALYDGIILSPGPGMPHESKGMMQVIKEYSGVKPILGVCLGMQGIGEYLGGDLYNLNKVQHGVQVQIKCDNNSVLFHEMDANFKVGLYHSWALDDKGEYKVVAESIDGTIMAIENEERQLFGVQYHPESVLSEFGKDVLQNFLIQV